MEKLEAPPSSSLPPQASRVLEALDRYRDQPVQTVVRQVFSLSRSQYHALQRHITANGGFIFLARFRAHMTYDWDVQQVEIHIRYGHAFARSIRSRIDDQLHFLEYADPSVDRLHFLKHADPSVNRALSGVRAVESSSVGLQLTDTDATEVFQSPDLQYQYRPGRWPSVVFKIAYSDERRALSRQAYNYLRGSDGNIAVVVAVDLGYHRPNTGHRPPPAEARLLVWRMRHVPSNGEDEAEVVSDAVLIHNEVFRTAAGDPAPGYFAFQLSDFLPVDLLRALPCGARSLAVTLHYSDLAADLSLFEKRYFKTDAGVGTRTPAARPWRKRKLTPPFPDEPGDGAERKRRRRGPEGDRDGQDTAAAAAAAARDADHPAGLGQGGEWDLPIRTRRIARLQGLDGM